MRKQTETIPQKHDFQKEIIKELENKHFIKFVCEEVQALGLSKEDVGHLTPDELYELIIRNCIYSKYVSLTRGAISCEVPPKEPELTLKSDPYIEFTLVEVSGISASFRESRKVSFCVDFGHTRYCSPTFSLPEQSLKLNVRVCLPLDFIDLKISKQNTINAIASCTEKIKVFIAEVDGDSDMRSVAAFKYVDWRYVLAHGKVELSLSCDWSNQYKENASKIKVKLLLALFPKTLRASGLAPHKLEAQIDKSNTESIERAQLFYDYSKIFWKSLDSQKAYVENNNARIFFRDETGTYRPAFCYVLPLRLRSILTPSHALRFASLLSVSDALGKDADLLVSFCFGLFESVHTYKFVNFLLASLLNGFGIKAWVVCGLNSNGECFWVLTQNQKDEKAQWRYWLVDKCEHIPVDDPKVHFLFRSIGCLVGAEEIFFNVQEDLPVW